MAILDTNHDRAAVIILVLGAALVIALSPFATGLIGIPVLYVVFTPLHNWLARHMRAGLAAALVVVSALFLIVVPGVSFAGLIVGQAQQIAGGVMQSPFLTRLSQVRIGEFQVGPQLAGLGRNVAAWLGSSAFSLVGTATRFAINLVISLFGLYYLLLRPAATWAAVGPYIPFSPANADKLRIRFRNVTTSTIIGTGLTAVIQGGMVAAGFAVAGLPNAPFWFVVATVLAVLPVVGSGLVWAPGALYLVFDQRYTAALVLALWGLVVVGNVAYVIQPMVFRRWAQIHPLVTLVGALAGIPYFGILGLLIGPLALSYFFELVRMYGEEYLESRPGRS
jgi:predicted PurR-regulated permease PerM